jgi:hypothetical protein
MGKIIADFPPIASNRGAWVLDQPRQLVGGAAEAARRQLHRLARCLAQRQSGAPAHSAPVERLLNGGPTSYRFIVLADTGEGDKSQYGLLPLIRYFKPDFMLINGDVAYPAGNTDDFVAGFFEPYRDLNIPIWATPGNHEYYSDQKGSEFYYTFCTYTWAARWSAYGLKLVPQPGMYWELEDARARQVVIGIDSGMKGNLDGDGKTRGDDNQHTWLTARLSRAETLGYKAIIMFHIPVLVNGAHARDTRLERLHRTISMFSCVKLVLTGHEHSFQQYSPAVFERYVQRDADPLPPRAELFPHYMVAGGGGAYVASTAWFGPDQRKKLAYPCDPVCPDDWAKYTSTHRPRKLGIGRSVFSRVVASFDEAATDDSDIPDMMSFVLVEVDRALAETVVTPVFQQDFERLFTSQPNGTRVHVQAGQPPPDQNIVDSECKQKALVFS